MTIGQIALLWRGFGGDSLGLDWQKTEAPDRKIQTLAAINMSMTCEAPFSGFQRSLAAGFSRAANLSLPQKVGNSFKNWESASHYIANLLRNAPNCPILTILLHSAKPRWMHCCKTMMLMRQRDPDETKALIYGRICARFVLREQRLWRRPKRERKLGALNHEKAFPLCRSWRSCADG